MDLFRKIKSKFAGKVPAEQVKIILPTLELSTMPCLLPRRFTSLAFTAIQVDSAKAKVEGAVDSATTNAMGQIDALAGQVNDARSQGMHASFATKCATASTETGCPAQIAPSMFGRSLH
jgi:hypothetical protein